MELDPGSAEELSLNPPIPFSGLQEALRAWSGKGDLIRALAARRRPLAEIDWSFRNIERRANRVYFPTLAHALKSWPVDAREWEAAIPASRRKARFRSDELRPGTSFVDTRIRGLWPPLQFVGIDSLRNTDTVLLRALKWGVERTTRIASDARKLEPTMVRPLLPQLAAFSALRHLPVLTSVTGKAPNKDEVAGIRMLGFPWYGLADCLDALIDFEEMGPEAFALRMVLPDPTLRWRLFHLAVFGVLMSAIVELGGTIRARRPIGGGGTGPEYQVEIDGAKWDLWFEAGGAWSYYGKAPSPYVQAATGVPGEDRSLGADVMLIRPESSALLIECKYSANARRVARSGYLQVVAYSGEVATELAQDVLAVAVGPDGCVSQTGYTQLAFATVALTSPMFLKAVVEDFLGRSSSG